jgi:hypothetical protein
MGFKPEVKKALLSAGVKDWPSHADDRGFRNPSHTGK